MKNYNHKNIKLFMLLCTLPGCEVHRDIEATTQVNQALTTEIHISNEAKQNTDVLFKNELKLEIFGIDSHIYTDELCLLITNQSSENIEYRYQFIFDDNQAGRRIITNNSTVIGSSDTLCIEADEIYAAQSSAYPNSLVLLVNGHAPSGDVYPYGERFIYLRNNNLISIFSQKHFNREFRNILSSEAILNESSNSSSLKPLGSVFVESFTPYPN